jgi:hypothetical protein
MRPYALMRAGALRAAIAAARPLLAAFVPGLLRGSRPVPMCELHVFARAPGTDYAGVNVSAGASVAELKSAAIAQLELGAAPHRVRLLREVEGGAPVPLDSRKTLAEESVSEGATVLVDVIAAHIAPPASTQPQLLTLNDEPAATPLVEFWGALQQKSAPTPSTLSHSRTPPPRLEAQQRTLFVLPRCPCCAARAAER